VHGLLTIADWSRLAYEARGLRGDMDAAFRKAFPEAKAVVDPALQMRRNIADLRRAAGEADAADFVPMLVSCRRSGHIQRQPAVACLSAASWSCSSRSAGRDSRAPREPDANPRSARAH
jgi:hypothetical protein